MDKEQRRAAKAQLVAGMQEGHSWQPAAAKAGLQINQSTAYRLWQAWRKCGETALEDGRHGHPSKLHCSAHNGVAPRCTKKAARRKETFLSLSVCVLSASLPYCTLAV
jgi:transposase